MGVQPPLQLSMHVHLQNLGDTTDLLIYRRRYTARISIKQSGAAADLATYAIKIVQMK